MTMVSSDPGGVIAEPGEPGASDKNLYETLMLAAELVDAITNQADRDRDSYNAGWRDAAKIFFDHGFEVGHARAHQEMAEEWHRVAEAVRPRRPGSILGGTPPRSFDELQSARAGRHTPTEDEELDEQETKMAEVIELKRDVA